MIAGAAPGLLVLLLSPGVNAMNIHHLPYIDQLEARDPQSITTIVIHATETPDLAYARELAEVIHYPGSGTGNSGHYYLDLDGMVHEYVPVERVAHHVRGHNRNSIGIEVVNAGRYPDWHHQAHQQWTAVYPQHQLKSLLSLVQSLRQRLPGIRCITRHSDLDQSWITASDDSQAQIRRKLDPGVTFPWSWLLDECGLPACGDGIEP
ncbi:MAG: N-acetylmuramoyl-L-alanine amidase [Wenzhouxiangellaceae bacterium]